MSRRGRVFLAALAALSLCAGMAAGHNPPQGGGVSWPLTSGGDLTMSSGDQILADGDAASAAPAIAAHDDTNTGLIWDVANRMSLVANGSVRMYIDGNGTAFNARIALRDVALTFGTGADAYLIGDGSTAGYVALGTTSGGTDGAFWSATIRATGIYNQSNTNYGVEPAATTVAIRANGSSRVVASSTLTTFNSVPVVLSDIAMVFGAGQDAFLVGDGSTAGLLQLGTTDGGTDGTLSLGTVVVPDGAVGACAIQIGGEVDDGFYAVGTNNLALALNGVQVINFVTTRTEFNHQIWAQGNAISGNTRKVEANTAVAASPHALTAVGDNSQVFTNEGATAENHHDLPTAVAGLTYTFVVQDADGMQVNCSTGDTLRIAGTVSASGGFVDSATVGDVLVITAINATEWVAETPVMGWTFD